MLFRPLAALLCAVVVVCAPLAQAYATIDPIPGIDIVVRKNPGGVIVARTQTNAKGTFVLKELAPGEYTVELDGKSLVAAVGRLNPSAKPKSSVAVGDVNADGRADTIKIELKEVLVSSYQTSGGTARAPQTHLDKATAKGVRMTFTATVSSPPPANPSSGTGQNSYTGTVTLTQRK